MPRRSASPIVTIDGPSGSGKGTISRAVARQVGWHLLDSGALYRLVALAGLAAGLDSPDERGEGSEADRPELQSPCNLVCRLLLVKKKKKTNLSPRPPSTLSSTTTLPLATSPFPGR